MNSSEYRPTIELGKGDDSVGWKNPASILTSGKETARHESLKAETEAQCPKQGYP